MNINHIKIVKDDKRFTDNGYITIGWEKDNLGWGRIILILNKDGTVDIDAEHMSKDFVKEIFAKVIDDAELI